MDISQQQFEEFIKLHTEPKELKDRLVMINAGKNYRNVQTDLMWVAWKESRNSLKPVGYLSATASVCLRRGSQTIITPENKGNCTPLYRLDK